MLKNESTNLSDDGITPVKWTVDSIEPVKRKSEISHGCVGALDQDFKEEEGRAR